MYETHLRRVRRTRTSKAAVRDRQAALQADRQDGIWPAGFWFSTSFRVETRNRVGYDRYEIRLNHEAADQGKPFTFSMLVLDLLIGPVEEPSGQDNPRGR